MLLLQGLIESLRYLKVLRNAQNGEAGRVSKSAKLGNSVIPPATRNGKNWILPGVYGKHSHLLKLRLG